MYGWVWRRLPGPLPVRVLLALALVSLVVLLCFGWVFPHYADGWLVPDQTVG